MTADSNSPTGAPKRAEPESFRARALMASLTVKDLPSSLAWYTDVIGFTLAEKYENDGKVVGASLKAGDVNILLNQDDGAKGMDRVKGEGFSLYFSTTQNVDDIARRIKDKGGTLLSEPTDMPWGARAFRLQDPDGFKFTISKETTER